MIGPGNNTGGAQSAPRKRINGREAVELEDGAWVYVPGVVRFKKEDVRRHEGSVNSGVPEQVFVAKQIADDIDRTWQREIDRAVELRTGGIEMPDFAFRERFRFVRFPNCPQMVWLYDDKEPILVRTDTVQRIVHHKLIVEWEVKHLARGEKGAVKGNAKEG